MKKDNKVCILLSTYNGEKYLEEQLLSIFNQTYWQNCVLFVRDDGSQDKTLDILKKYESKNMLTLVSGENIGFVKSFFYLLNNVPTADYYAFADQDDIWLDRKIEIAIDALKVKNNTLPLLYYSNFDFYDEKMNFISHSKFDTKVPSFETLLTQSLLTGMTFVLNINLRNLLIMLNPEKIDGHDYITAIIASSMGELVGDNTVTVKYRRHSSNVSLQKHNGIELFIWRFKRFFLNKNNKIGLQINEFKKCFSEKISKKDLYFLNLVTNDKSISFSKVKLLFYPKRLRTNIIEDLMLRLFLFLGVL